MDDNEKTTVPEQEAPVAPPTQTEVESTSSKPTSTAPAVNYLTRDELPSLVQQIIQQHTGKFVTTEEAERLAKKAGQSGADSRYAKLMKQLRPEMKEIDELVKDGLLDKDQAEARKNQKLMNASLSLADENAEPEPMLQPEAPPAPAPAIDWGARAMRMMTKNGFKLTDFPELQAKIATVGSVSYDEIEDAVFKRKEAVLEQTKETEWMKKYEERHKPVKDAEKAGAVTAPPTGTAAGNAQAELEKLNQQGPPDDPKGAQEYLKKIKALHKKMDEGTG